MRQLFTWRFAAVVAVLAGLAWMANALLFEEELTAVVDTSVQSRRIDLIAPVRSTEFSGDFQIGRDGLTDGVIDFVLDDQRIMRVAPGTPGEIACPEIDQSDKCAVFVDLLGEAVIWFAVLPKAPRETVELPPVIDLEDGYALFASGWQIAYPPVIERICEGEDVVSFSDFLRRFGPQSTSVIDLQTQQVTQVRCAGNAAPELPPTTVAEPLDIPIDAPVLDSG